MSIFVIGINHKTAPIHVREKIYFKPEAISLYLQDLQSHQINEAMLLSTCNRTEIYCVTDNIHKVCDWFFAQTNLPRHEVEKVLYIYRGKEAIAHSMQVACGLDSMIIGESQILGQMKEVFSESCAAGLVGPVFHRWFQQVFKVAKEIRTSTAIGACPVSVASAAIHFAKQQINLDNATIVLLGAGDTTQLLLQYLRQTKNISIVNRHADTAVNLAAKYQYKGFGLDKLADVLVNADIIFSATNSTFPIVNKSIIEKIISTRIAKPLYMIDIAVPRDIDPEVTQFDFVKLFCIDDLKMIIEHNKQGRAHAAQKAQEMILQKSKELMHEWQAIDKVSHTINAYRGQIEELCYLELEKAKQQLELGDNPKRVLEKFAHAFTQKLLHIPSVKLRQAGAEGRFELLQYAKQLFALPDELN